MDKRQLAEMIVRLVKREVKKQVEREVDKLMTEMKIEVSGMINYSERKMLTVINEMNIRTNKTYRKTIDESDSKSDLSKVMDNLKTMDSYKGFVESVEMPEQEQPTYSSDNMLNELLNSTQPFSKEEMSAGSMYNVPVDMGDMGDMGDNIAGSFTTTEHSTEPVREQKLPKTILGTDLKPVNVNNPAVQKVLSVLANSDHASKYKEIKESGDSFKDGMPVRQFSHDYFERTIID